MMNVRGRHEKIQLIGFCDDLTFILKGPLAESFTVLLDVITEFCESGSDFAVNPKKTTLMSTEVLTPDELEIIKKSKWPKLPRVSRSVILGVDFGTKVDQEDIWLKKVQKIERLAKEFATQGKMAPGNRMRYANIYLIPVLLFTAQFYPIPEWVEHRVLAAVAGLTLPKVKAVPWSIMFADAKFGGLAVKLRDFIAEGKAAIMRTLGPFYMRKYDQPLFKRGMPAFLVEWHHLHPMCSIAYVAYKHWSAFLVARGLLEKGTTITQKEFTGAFTSEEVRATRKRRKRYMKNTPSDGRRRNYVMKMESAGRKSVLITSLCVWKK